MTRAAAAGCPLCHVLLLRTIACNVQMPVTVAAAPCRCPRSDPVNYKDDNHKPEMALALEDFQALCNFVTTAELKEALQQTPELSDCVGSEAAGKLLDADEKSEKEVRHRHRAGMMQCLPRALGRF